MRRYVFVLTLAALTMAAASAQDGVSSQFMIHLCVRQGGPEAGNQKVLSRPQIITTDKHAAKIHIGQEVAFGSSSVNTGIEIQLTPEKVKGGKVRLELHGEISEPVTYKDGAFQINSSTVRYLGTVKLGELNKVNVGEVSGHKTWLEFRVEEVVPKAQAKRGPGLDGEKKPR